MGIRPLLLALLLAGCAHEAPKPEAVELEPVTRLVVIPRRCGVVRLEWLARPQAVKKAEGVVANALDLAERRGEQVDELNRQIGTTGENLSRIAGLLKKYGCIEVVK